MVFYNRTWEFSEFPIRILQKKKMQNTTLMLKLQKLNSNIYFHAINLSNNSNTLKDAICIQKLNQNQDSKSSSNLPHKEKYQLIQSLHHVRTTNADQWTLPTHACISKHNTSTSNYIQTINQLLNKGK